MPMKYFFILLVLIASPVYAESAPPSEESIKHLLDVAEAHKLVDSMMNQMDAMMKNTMQRSLQGRPVNPKQQKVIDDMESKAVALLKQELNWDRLEPIYVRIYQKSFTQEEINGMLDFYKTSAGQAMVKKMPVVMQQSMIEIQGMLPPIMAKLQKIEQDAVAELKDQPAN